MFDRSPECDAVLARYGLAQCSMTTIGAEKTRGLPLWGVEITCHGGRPEFFEVMPASQLADDLRRIGEKSLAERIGLATETAKRKMRLGQKRN